ncbi:hypothetical protein [Azospirillum thermophilum]|uniref:Uncharacterized protein n=1 Tax=Azospirillum thermophilum TaxID=2202148 RepID=A0A2S2CSZ1_9PROT|nr:hypothetical protein [Azospirillum thermophilum]AWK87631.1 hypothetical protein DEW08_16685 [Azospirillum thermophilum]
MTTLYCACCGRPFKRTSNRGPAPLYCSRDCRLQIAARRRAWGPVDWGLPAATAQALMAVRQPADRLAKSA